MAYRLPCAKIQNPKSKILRAFLSAARDLLRGLFSLPTADAPADCDYARTLEERYSKPRRCC